MTSLFDYSLCQTSCTTSIIAYHTSGGTPITIADAPLSILSSNGPAIARIIGPTLASCMLSCASTFLSSAVLESIAQDVTFAPYDTISLGARIGTVGAVGVAGGFTGVSAVSGGWGTAGGLAIMGFTTSPFVWPLVGAVVGVGVAMGVAAGYYARERYARVWDVTSSFPGVMLTQEMPFVVAEEVEGKCLCPVDFRVRVRYPEGLEGAKKCELDDFGVVGREGELNKIDDGEVFVQLDEYGEVALPREMVEPIVDVKVAVAQAVEIRKWKRDKGRQEFPLLYN